MISESVPIIEECPLRSPNDTGCPYFVAVSPNRLLLTRVIPKVKVELSLSCGHGQVVFKLSTIKMHHAWNKVDVKLSPSGHQADATKITMRVA